MTDLQFAKFIEVYEDHQMPHPIEDYCAHGVGHSQEVHGCDGCCEVFKRPEITGGVLGVSTLKNRGVQNEPMVGANNWFDVRVVADCEQLP